MRSGNSLTLSFALDPLDGFFKWDRRFPGGHGFVVCADILEIFKLFEEFLVLLNADDNSNLFTALVYNELAFFSHEKLTQRSLLRRGKESNPNEVGMLKSAIRRRKRKQL